MMKAIRSILLFTAIVFSAILLHAETNNPEESLKKLYKGLIGSADSKQSLKQRNELVEKLFKLRKSALEFIEDSSKYTNDHTKGQPEVSKLIGELQKFYKDWEKFVNTDESALKKLPATAAKKKLVELEKLEPITQTSESNLTTDEFKFIMHLQSGDFYNTVNLGENLLTNASLPDWKREIISRYVSEAIMQYNKTVKHSMTKLELEAVSYGNDYRMLLGRRALEIDERLVQAGRKHSKETAKLGLHGHDEPTKGQENPQQRCKLEGYDNSVGENFSGYAPSGLEAIGASKSIITPNKIGGWFYSAGHHRNMISTSHRQIGVGMSPSGGCPGYSYGRCQNHWTQNFGGGSAFDAPPKKEGKEEKPENK
jgi:uncharacterized protein YkwD